MEGWREKQGASSLGQGRPAVCAGLESPPEAPWGKQVNTFLLSFSCEARLRGLLPVVLAFMLLRRREVSGVSTRAWNPGTWGVIPGFLAVEQVHHSEDILCFT